MNTTEFNYYLDAYINFINKIPLIEKDSRGFYTAKIAEIRYVPQNYKCYKIYGLLKLDEPPLPEETHWIFYRTGMYQELKVGDMIRLKVSQTEVRQFKDLCNARNIYPDTLEIV